jgi:hypothetical protein
MVRKPLKTLIKSGCARGRCKWLISLGFWWTRAAPKWLKLKGNLGVEPSEVATTTLIHLVG